MSHPAGIHGFLVRQRERFIAPRFSLGAIFPADFLGALFARWIVGGDFFLQRSQELFERVFNFSGQTEISLIAVVRNIWTQGTLVEQRDGGPRRGGGSPNWLMNYVG